PTRTVRRKNAMAALWPEQEAETASDNLDKCVETLRQLLEPVRSARGQSTRHGLPLLRSEGGSLILAEQARVWVDADAFEYLLAHDPLNEAAVQLLITALAQSQRRGEALRAYQRLADLLQREYESIPSEKTRTLYEAVLRGDDQDVLPGSSSSRGTSTVSWEI